MTDHRSCDLTLDAWAPDKFFNISTLRTAEQRHEVGWNIVNTPRDHNASTTGGTSIADALRPMFGQDFALNLGSSDHRSHWAIRESGDVQSFDGEDYDGTVSSAYLGANATIGESWIMGVAVASNSGESDYSRGTAAQSMNIRLSSLLPYVSYRLTDRASIWGVAGFGSGELETTVIGSDDQQGALNSQLALVGASQQLKSTGRLNVAFRGDVASASFETDSGDGAAYSISADVSRIRLGLESSFRTETSIGGIVEPFGQASVRSDEGDGDNGTGVEIIGGLHITGNSFHFEAQGRSLAMHTPIHTVNQASASSPK